MSNLNKSKFAIASGLTAVVIYLGCYLTMAILGKDSLVKISNLLFHGMDFSNIIRMDIPIGETLLGVLVSFVFWGAVGYFFAFAYNKMMAK